MSKRRTGGRWFFRLHRGCRSQEFSLWLEGGRKGKGGWMVDFRYAIKSYSFRFTLQKFRIRSSQWTRVRHTFTRAQGDRRDDEILWRQKFRHADRSLRKSLETFTRSWRRRCRVVHANRAMEFHFPRSPYICISPVETQTNFFPAGRAKI